MFCCQLHYNIEDDCADSSGFMEQNVCSLEQGVIPHNNIPELSGSKYNKTQKCMVTAEIVDQGPNANDFGLTTQTSCSVLAKSSHNGQQCKQEKDALEQIEDIIVKEEPQFAESCVENQEAVAHINHEIPRLTKDHLCSVCDLVFDNKSLLKRHEKTAKHTKRSDRLLATRRGGVGRNMPTCNICHASFEYSKELVTHFQKMHPETELKIYPCTECEEVFFVYKSLLYHTNFHTDLFKCSQCGRRHGSKSDLERHTKTHSKQKIKLPGKVVSRKVEFDVNKQKSQSVDPESLNETDITEAALKCDTKNHDQATQEILREKCTTEFYDTIFKKEPQHQQKVDIAERQHGTNTNKYDSDIGDKVADHRIHQDSPTIKCDQAEHDEFEHVEDIVVKEEPQLAEPCVESHVMNTQISHKLDQPRVDHACLSCDMAFKNKSHLKRHEETISHRKKASGEEYLASRGGSRGRTAPMCHICQVTFKHSKEIVTHFEEAHPERELKYFPCSECEEVFFTPRSINEHGYLHSDAYKCEFCGKRHVTRTYLERHWKKHPTHRAVLKKDRRMVLKQMKSSDASVTGRACGGRRNEPTCNICQLKFKHSKEVLTHFKKVHPETKFKSYPCSYCDKVFFVYSSFLYHSHTHADTYKCNQCGRRNGSKSDLDKHIQIHAAPDVKAQARAQSVNSSSKKLLASRRGGVDRNAPTCNVCQVSFRHSKEVVTHFKDVHPETKFEPFLCNKCEEVFFSYRSFLYHSHTHGDAYTCHLCGKRHASKSLLDRHNQTHRNKQLQKQTKTEKTIKAKRVKPLGRRPLATRRGGTSRNKPTCNVCNATFAHPKEILIHFKEVHPKMKLKSYSCEYCEEVCFSSNLFRYHANLHTDLYKCTQCGKRHSKKSELTRHEQNHHTQKNELLANRRGGVGLNVPTCSVCQVSFEHSKELVTHFKEVHPETGLKSYPCIDCDKVFFVYSSFLYHSNLHKDRHKCQQCGRRHGSASDLKRHEISFHSNAVKSHSTKAKRKVKPGRIEQERTERVEQSQHCEYEKALATYNGTVIKEESALAVSELHDEFPGPHHGLDDAEQFEDILVKEEPQLA